MSYSVKKSWFNKTFKSIVIFFTMFIFTQNLVANEQADLKKHFLNLIGEITIIVENKTLSTELRNSNIVDVLTPTFDFELMAKLSLGKVWKTLEKQNKNKFIKLYVKRMERSYSSKLDSYDNEEVKIKKIMQPKKNRIALVTDLVSKDKNLEIVYKFYKPKKQKSLKDLWLIYDVEILGISISKADKAQFREFLKTRTIYDLMDILAK